VEVGVQEDDRERQDEDRVRRVQFTGYAGVTDAVPMAKHFHQPLDLLRLAGHPEVCLELPECEVDLGPGKVDLRSERCQHSLIERGADIAEVLPDHLLGQPLPGEQEPRHRRG